MVRIWIVLDIAESGTVSPRVMVRGKQGEAFGDLEAAEMLERYLRMQGLRWVCDACDLAGDCPLSSAVGRLCELRQRAGPDGQGGAPGPGSEG